MVYIRNVSYENDHFDSYSNALLMLSFCFVYLCLIRYFNNLPAEHNLSEVALCVVVYESDPQDVQAKDDFVS